MYTKEQLKNLDKIPKLKDISLKLIQEFYFEYLTDKIYTYKLRAHRSKDEFEIKIRFFTENLPHLLGIQKVAQINKRLYQGKSGYDRIVNETITIESLKAIDAQRSERDRILPTIENRITCFHLIPKLMTECEMIKFSSKKVKGNCNINSDLVLYKKELGVKLHLGAVNENNTTIYIPETFIVKSLRARDVDRLTVGQQYMNIINLNIENTNFLKKENGA